MSELFDLFYHVRCESVQVTDVSQRRNWKWTGFHRYCPTVSSMWNWKLEFIKWFKCFSVTGGCCFFFFFLKRVEGFGLFLCLVQLQLSLCTYQPWPRSVGSLTRPERAERCRKIGANTELGHKVEKRREEVGTDREFAVQDLYGGSCQLYFHDIW